MLIAFFDSLVANFDILYNLDESMSISTFLILEVLPETMRKGYPIPEISNDISQ